MSIELKIKSIHLSYEPAIIRKEEQKLKKQAKWEREHQQDDFATMYKFRSLNSHRRGIVRNESRATNLARAYLAGKEYNTVEYKRKSDKESIFNYSVLPRVLDMVNKYGNKKITKQELIDWSKLE